MNNKRLKQDLETWNKNCEPGDEMPEMCVLPHPYDGSFILVKFGEVGYWPAPQFKTQKDADKFNNHRKITPEQLTAMEIGSHFGFHVKGARPTTIKKRVAV